MQGFINQRNKNLANLRKARSESKNSSSITSSPGGSFIGEDGLNKDSLKRVVNKVIAVDIIKPKKADKLAGIKAFKVRSGSKERPITRVNLKEDIKIDSYTNLPIHEFSQYVKHEEMKDLFEKMSVKLPKIV